VKVSDIELFAKPIRRSLLCVVEMFGLATLTVCVPASSPMAEIASIGLEVSEPLTTNTEITSDCAADKFSVKVWPGPTVGLFAYQIWLRKSKPADVLVGPAAEIQVLLKLSEGVIVTPA
jgi:hypothetical protein